MRRLIIAFVCLLGFAFPSFAEEPIRIGLTLGLTGNYSEMSAEQMKGFRLWERYVNRGHGILGRKVTLIIYDDKSDPGTAVNLYEHLITRDKVDLLFGPYSSEITEAVLPVTEKYRYPLLTSGASADRLWQKGYKYVFGIYNPASKYAVGFLELLVKNDIKTVAIVHAEDSFSADMARGARKWAERFALKVVLFESIGNGTPVLLDAARKGMTSGAEVLMVCGHFNEAANMRLALKKVGWHPRAFFATVGPALRTFVTRLGPDAESTFSSSQWEHHGGIYPPGCCEFSDFYEGYVNTYKEEPSYHSATAFAAGQILKAALVKTGGLDRERLRNALLGMDAMSILGRFGVDSRGMQTKHFNLIVQWQKGKKEIVWPEELRTARPVFR